MNVATHSYLLFAYNSQYLTNFQYDNNPRCIPRPRWVNSVNNLASFKLATTK
jgi:hypothetical protein